MVNIQPAFCPRCDRQYLDSRSYKASVKMMEKHVKESHPDMQGFLESLEETPVDNSLSPELDG